MRFSYGEMIDGEFAIWAQGLAGWFEIRPASHYASIYADMIQAVQILYFVTDIYSEPRKRGGGPSPQLVFQEVRQLLGRMVTNPTDVDSMRRTTDFRVSTQPLQPRSFINTASF